MLFLFYQIYSVMVSIYKGKVYINGEHTTNPELIGHAMLDYADNTAYDSYGIELKEQDVFVTQTEKSACETLT